MSLSDPLQWRHAPTSNNQSRSPGHNHAKLMGTLSPSIRRPPFFFFTDLPSAEDMHAYPRYCIHTHQERRTHLLRRRVQTARCRVLSLASPAGLDQMAGEYKRGVLLLSLYLSECTIVIMAPLNCHSGFIKVEGVGTLQKAWSDPSLQLLVERGNSLSMRISSLEFC